MIRRFALLQTFVAVARAGKMKQTAHELALTPGAVSQRIRQLEEAAGRRLFTRNRAGVELSAAGVTMFEALAEPFRTIETVDRELGAPSPRRVTVSTTPSFAVSWLVLRLATFAKHYPDIEIAVETGGRPVDLRREPIDLAIRHGLGKYPGLEATWLIAPELIVVASPDLLKNQVPLGKPADCLAFPLLHDLNRQDWPFWFEAHGIAAPNCKKGPAFSENHLIVRAAVAGQGLALVRDIYAKDDLRSKKLVKPFTVNWPVQFAYYAVATSETLQKPAVRRFRDWLVEEARQEI
ncbi:MAG TPA: LysR substrate-binding domain-containing protein [Stellaceae bacterium]|nr:LysR substrate-binding domain-containing protein [Stellaceae bacterium]